MLIGKPKAQISRLPDSYTLKLYVPNDIDPDAQVMLTVYEDGTTAASYQKNHDGYVAKFGSLWDAMGFLAPFLPETLL